MIHLSFWSILGLIQKVVKRAELSCSPTGHLFRTWLSCEFTFSVCCIFYGFWHSFGLRYMQSAQKGNVQPKHTQFLVEKYGVWAPILQISFQKRDEGCILGNCGWLIGTSFVWFSSGLKLGFKFGVFEKMFSKKCTNWTFSPTQNVLSTSKSWTYGKYFDKEFGIQIVFFIKELYLFRWVKLKIVCLQWHLHCNSECLVGS